jgi:hypothetical protein
MGGIMGKQCKNCGTEIGESYLYCSPCVKKWRENQNGEKQVEGTITARTPEKKWDDDPVVDQLKKINANHGLLVKELHNIGLCLESIATSIQEERATKKVRSMHRAKPGIDE